MTWLLPLASRMAPFLLVTCVVWVIVIVVFMVSLWLRIRSYHRTPYFADTRTSFWAVRRDTGAYGEYQTYVHLRKLPGQKRFLFNCYVPKDDSTTTEIDVIMLHGSGIYVFESKNYSGWIFGNESQRSWTQTFPSGRKEHFYNPLMQNTTHITWLARLFPALPPDVYHSIIVFSERCTVKKLVMTSGYHQVVQRNHVLGAVTPTLHHTVLTDETIEEIYTTLYPLTQVSDDVRQAHITSIHDSEKHYFS